LFLPKLIKENPAAIKAFLEAFTKGAKEVIANSDDAIQYVKQRDGIINVDLEKRRLKLAIKDASCYTGRQGRRVWYFEFATLSLNGIPSIRYLQNESARKSGCCIGMARSYLLQV
jgi:hypothetical protein